MIFPTVDGDGVNFQEGVGSSTNKTHEDRGKKGENSMSRNPQNRGACGDCLICVRANLALVCIYCAETHTHTLQYTWLNRHRIVSHTKWQKAFVSLLNYFE